MLSFKSLDEIDLQNNQVLIKPSGGNTKYRLDNGVIISIDTEFEPGKYADVNGTVMKVPTKLNFDQNILNPMMWETEMELKAGDYVTYYFLSAHNAFDVHQPKYCEVNGEILIFVSYQDIYLAKREVDVSLNRADSLLAEQSLHPNYFITEEFDVVSMQDVKVTYEIIPINGNLIIEPMPRQFFETDYFYSPDKGQTHGGVGIIRYVGKPVKYFEKVWSDESQINVKHGEVVAFWPNANILLEVPLLSSFSDKRFYFRMQRRRIAAQINLSRAHEIDTKAYKEKKSRMHKLW